MKKATRIGIAAAFGIATAMAFSASTIAQPGYYGARPDAAGGMSSPSDVPGSGTQSGSSGLFESPAAGELSGAMTEEYSRMEPNRPGQFDRRSEWSQQSRYGRSGSNEYGSRADGMPYDLLIVLGSNTQSVSVAHGETVKFVTPSGQEFRWRFDTARRLERFPLARIAPPDVSVSPQASVFVTGDSPTDRS